MVGLVGIGLRGARILAVGDAVGVVVRAADVPRAVAIPVIGAGVRRRRCLPAET